MATLYDGLKTTYVDTTPQVRVITDYIPLLSPTDTPLQARFGVHGSPPAMWKIKGWPGKKVEWLEDELLPMSDQLDGSITSTATTITVDDASVFHVGDRLLIDSEELAVTARNTSTQVVTVASRGDFGSTAATHADDATVDKIGGARLEGADSDEGSFVDVSSSYNVTAILHDEFRVSETEKVISQYGISDVAAYQGDKKAKELAKLLEKNLHVGGRSDGSSTTGRGMGSIDYYLNVSGGNTVDASGGFTQAIFENALKAAYNDGGSPSVAIASPNSMQKIKNFYDTSSFLRIERDERTVGMVIDRVLSPYGEVELVMSRYQPDATIPILDPEHYSGVLALRGWTQRLLSKDGDSDKWEMVGEFTQLIRYGATAHAMIIGIP